MYDLHFAGYTLYPHRRELRRDDELIPLTPKAFDLLQFLAENPGRPLPKSEILDAVWPGTFVEESNLNQNIFMIRRALGPQSDRLIVTLPRLGYQFTAAVTREALTPIPSARSPSFAGNSSQVGLSPAPTETSTRTTQLTYEEKIEDRVVLHRSPAAWAIALAGLLLFAAVAWVGWLRWQDHVGGPAVQVVVAEPDGSTGDPVLDRTLATVFRMELAQSPFVTVLSGTNIRAKMVQMQHQPDDHLSPTLAREVCERTASQAVVHGSMARVGSHYLLTEEAINCVDGASLGEGSREVGSAEQLPGALAKLAAQMRHSLGESRRTIARFSHPLAPVTTGSLDALKDLTESERLAALGRVPEAVDLLKQAVALDPGFAGAWLDLSTHALNAHETRTGHDYLQKAYDLQANAAEPTRRTIVARYSGEVTGDLYESLRNYQTWTEEYPHQVVPWSGMTVTYRALGRPQELYAAQRTMAVAPTYLAVYQALAEAQTRAGDFADARATLETAIAKGFDGDSIRTLLLRLAYLIKDAPLRAEQEAWGREHPNSPYLLANEAFLDELEGRSDEGKRVFDRTLEACRHLGQEELLDDLQAQMAIFESALGHPEQAHSRLVAVRPNPADPAYLYALQYTGEGSKIEPLLREQLATHPRSTLWNDWDGPILRGKMLLDAQKPSEALQVLAPTVVFDGKDVDAIYLRGLAHMHLRQLPEAAAEFHKIIDHPQINPTAIQRPMARLQLARALALEGNKAAAAEAYTTFLASWSHANPGEPLPAIATSELAALRR